jgi:uncharacterized glyoxalase superfamily protein PhnB
MNPTPEGWPRISSAVFYLDAKKAIEWLCDAFGFEVRLKVEDETGAVVHSELTYGDGLIMVGQQGHVVQPYQSSMISPRSVNGGNTQNLFVYVDDVEAHYRRALGAGAEVFRELETSDYGADYWSDRGYGVRDPDGHMWFFAQRLRGK